MMHTLTQADALALWPLYLTTQTARVQWNGSLARGDAGRIAQSSIDAILIRINMYRAAAGLEPVVNNTALNQACQECAFVLHANPTWIISHSLPTTLKFYTRDAARAAQNSNIDRGDEGPKAIADFMRDWGMTSQNKGVGHRRWFLHPGLRSVGVGAVPPAMNNPASCCVYVRTSMTDTTQAVAWPPAGHVPIAWVPERWSYSPGPGVDVSQAVVTVDGIRLGATRQRGTSPPSAIVFTPVLPFNSETTHEVRITGIPEPVEYNVHRFRP